MHSKLRLGLLFGLFFVLMIGNAYAKPSFGENCAQCHIAPTVTNFELPAMHDSLTVPIISFTATDTDDNVPSMAVVTGYMVTATPTEPAADDEGWQSSPPGEFTVDIDGVHTLYAWAKDAIGNVSEAVFSTVDIDMSGTNAPPVADAGPDQSVNEGATVTLNGSNSDDSDDGIESFFWEQVDTASPVTLSDPAAEQPTFTAPDVGPDGAALTFRLTVTDYSGATSSDTCIVNVSSANIAPVADAGPDQTVAEGVSVTLDGSASSGVDDDIATYMWEQVDTTGVIVELSDPTVPMPEFTIEDVDADGVSLTFQLTVTDEGGLQATDTCVINVTSDNQAPVADAGVDQSVTSGAEVALDASGSSDPDGDAISYAWKQISGLPVTLSAASAVNPTFAAPQVAAGTTETLTFELTVTDAGQLQAMDSCDVQVIGEEPPPDDDDANDDDADDDDANDDDANDDDTDDDDGCDHDHHHDHHNWHWPEWAKDWFHNWYLQFSD